MRTFLTLAFSTLLFAACSSGNGSSPSPAPAPPAACATQWTAAKTVVSNDCVSCHNGSNHPALLPEATFDASGVRAQVDTGKMPPAPATLAAADKATLDAYLTCIGQ